MLWEAGMALMAAALCSWGCWYPDTAFSGSPEQHPGFALPWAQQQQLPGVSGEPSMVTAQEMGTVAPSPEEWNVLTVPGCLYSKEHFVTATWFRAFSSRVRESF